MASVEASAENADLHVAVGSRNPVKINAVKDGFQVMFPGRKIVVYGYDVASGVPDQPVGHEETLQGAVNRAQAAAKAHDAEATIEFSVGLEGGVVASGGLQLSSRTPSASGSDHVPSHEAKGAQTTAATTASNPLNTPSLSCFAYMAVLHCSSNTWGHAATGSFPLPPPVVALVASGMELGHADDAVFKRSNSKQSNGAVGLLTHGVIDRTAYYVHAMVLALTAFVHPEHYNTPPIQGRLGQDSS